MGKIKDKVEKEESMKKEKRIEIIGGGVIGV